MKFTRCSPWPRHWKRPQGPKLRSRGTSSYESDLVVTGHSNNAQEICWNYQLVRVRHELGQDNIGGEQGCIFIKLNIKINITRHQHRPLPLLSSNLFPRFVRSLSPLDLVTSFPCSSRSIYTKEHFKIFMSFLSCDVGF